MEWKNVINIDETEYEDWSIGDKYRGKAAGMAETMGAEKLGYHLEILPPGKFTCPYHFHHAEEELFLVLEGAAMLRQNGRYREVKTGDLVFFGTGPGGAHQFYNHTDRDFRFFALSNRDRLDLAEYPDSKKIKIRGLGKVFENETEVPYLMGEEDPSGFWEAGYLEGPGGGKK